MIGITLSHYRITRELGAGGMGVVYEAEDTKLKRTVALKFLPPESTRDPDAKARFIHEAQAASALDHPNVCTIYEVNETDDGQLFLAMACYEGEILKERIARGPLPLDDALDITRQVAEGLTKAHEREIVHRDIKPANIFITTDGLVKILDFGLAKLAGQSRLTQTGTTLGTVAYMSPEQARGEACDHHTDIWSLGVVMYEMFTGRLPFRGDHEQAIIYSILNKRPAKLEKQGCDMPLDLENIVYRCLAKESSKRYRLAEDLLADIEPLAKRLGILPRRGPFGRWFARHRWHVMSTGAIGLTLTVILALALHFGPADRREIDSLAVLPFQDPGAAADEVYLAESLTGELIACLSRIADLKVISRRSVAGYQDTDKSPAEIAAELDVEGLVAVDMDRDGQRFQIAVELIHSATEEVLWAEKFEANRQRLLPVQHEIAVAIANMVGKELSSRQPEQMRSKPSSDPAADELYLKARHNFFHGDQDKARERYEEALAIDPFHARAYSGLALCLRETAMWHSFRREIYPQAKAAAVKALELDESIADAHAVLALVHAEFDWDWPGAQREFLRALELEPANAAAHLYYGCELLAQMRFDDGIGHIRQAVELDPLSLYMRKTHAWSHIWAQRYDEAIALFNEILIVHPEDEFSKSFLAWTCALKGESVDAFVTFADTNSFMLPEMYALADQKERALELVLKREQAFREGESPENAIIAARVYAILGENDMAFEWLQKAYEARYAGLLFLRIDPMLQALRTDPRYDDLVHKIGYWSDNSDSEQKG